MAHHTHRARERGGSRPLMLTGFAVAGPVLIPACSWTSHQDPETSLGEEETEAQLWDS